MNFYKQILTLFFATIIFIGTVGVNVFAHYCKKDGIDYSFISPKEGHCHKKETQKGCCLTDIEIPKESPQVNEDCCSNEVTSFKISSELVQKEISNHHIIAQSVYSPILIHGVVIQDSEPDLTYFSLRQPIPKSGRDLLIKNQVFTI